MDTIILRDVFRRVGDTSQNTCRICIGICREHRIPTTYSSIFRDVFRRVGGYESEYV